MYCTLLFCVLDSIVLCFGLYCSVYCTLLFYVLHSIVLYIGLYCSVYWTLLFCVLDSIVLRIGLYCSVYCTLLFSIVAVPDLPAEVKLRVSLLLFCVLYSIVLCIVLYCSVYCTLLFCVMYSIVLYCSGAGPTGGGRTHGMSVAVRTDPVEADQWELLTRRRVHHRVQHLVRPQPLDGR